MPISDEHIRELAEMVKRSQEQQQDPKAQTLMAASKMVGPSGSSAPIQFMQPQDGQGQDIATDQAKADQLHRSELERKDKEINDLRNKAQKAQLDLDTVKARMELDNQHRKNLDRIRLEQDKLRAAQQQRAADDEAQKAQLAQYAADKKVEIADFKSKAMSDIAQRNAEQYVKTTDEAKRNADEYFNGQMKELEKQRAESPAPGVSQYVLSGVQNAVKAVNGLSRVRGKIQATPIISLSEKTAATDDELRQQALDEMGRQNAETAMQSANNQFGTGSGDKLSEHALSEAHIQNLLRRAELEGDDDAVAGYRRALTRAHDRFEGRQAELSAASARGGNAARDAMLERADLGDMQYRRGGDRSELEQIAQAADIEREQEETDKNFWHNNWLGNGLRWVGEEILAKPYTEFRDSLLDYSQAQNAAHRRGIEMNFFDSTADKDDVARQSFNRAVQSRGLNATAGGNIASVAGSGAIAAMDAAGTAAMVVPGIGTGAGIGLKSLAGAARAASYGARAARAANAATSLGRAAHGVSAAARYAGNGVVNTVRNGVTGVRNAAEAARTAARTARQQATAGFWSNPIGNAWQYATNIPVTGGYMSGAVNTLGRYNVLGTGYAGTAGRVGNFINSHGGKAIGGLMDTKPFRYAFNADLGRFGASMFTDLPQVTSTYAPTNQMQTHFQVAANPAYASQTLHGLGGGSGPGTSWVNMIKSSAVEPGSPAALRNGGYNDESPYGWNLTWGQGATGGLRKAIDIASPFIQAATGGLVSIMPGSERGLFAAERPADKKTSMYGALASAFAPEALFKNRNIMPADPMGLTPKGRALHEAWYAGRMNRLAPYTGQQYGLLPRTYPSAGAFI